MATPEGYGDVSLKFVLSGFTRAAYLTYGIEIPAGDAQTAANGCRDSWLSSGGPNTQLDNNVTMTEATVRMGTSSGEDLVGTAINATPGGKAGNANSPNVAVLVHKRTARGGRRGRGRFFIPWFGEETYVAEDGTISGANFTTLQTAVTNWFNDHDTRGYPMVVLHRPGLTVEGAPNVVTALVVSNLVGTQRRRLDR